MPLRSCDIYPVTLGASDTVLRTEIVGLESNRSSVMPEGLDAELGKQGLADVVAYLMAIE